jgi:hypothetical protein
MIQQDRPCDTIFHLGMRPILSDQGLSKAISASRYSCFLSRTTSGSQHRWRAVLRYDHFGHRYKLYLPHADKLLRFSTQFVAHRVKV